ncbi:hypothetical protein HD597_000543 [Nonomuraea thailandensis]|uniref:Uncharacterized protein n=1 Tax=Nonomuraea thailandensis TaxID=1188745 RepID=A0A9X2GF49_9ACTN|nr:hypothetical protein [Nonomuraea thailandensis]MCP2353523.1 hypothetical protein [Nonomuraea thailandensis]
MRGSDLTEWFHPGGSHEAFNDSSKEEILDDVTSFPGRALTVGNPGHSPVAA